MSFGQSKTLLTSLDIPSEIPANILMEDDLLLAILSYKPGKYDVDDLPDINKVYKPVEKNMRTKGKQYGVRSTRVVSMPNISLGKDLPLVPAKIRNSDEYNSDDIDNNIIQSYTWMKNDSESSFDSIYKGLEDNRYSIGSSVDSDSSDGSLRLRNQRFTSNTTATTNSSSPAINQDISYDSIFSGPKAQKNPNTLLNIADRFKKGNHEANKPRIVSAPPVVNKPVPIAIVTQPKRSQSQVKATLTPPKSRAESKTKRSKLSFIKRAFTRYSIQLENPISITRNARTTKISKPVSRSNSRSASPLNANFNHEPVKISQPNKRYTIHTEMPSKMDRDDVSAYSMDSFYKSINDKISSPKLFFTEEDLDIPLSAIDNADQFLVVSPTVQRKLSTQLKSALSNKRTSGPIDVSPGFINGRPKSVTFDEKPAIYDRSLTPSTINQEYSNQIDYISDTSSVFSSEEIQQLRNEGVIAPNMMVRPSSAEPRYGLPPSPVPDRKSLSEPKTNKDLQQESRNRSDSPFDTLQRKLSSKIKDAIRRRSIHEENPITREVVEAEDSTIEPEDTVLDDDKPSLHYVAIEDVLSDYSMDNFYKQLNDGQINDDGSSIKLNFEEKPQDLFFPPQEVNEKEPAGVTNNEISRKTSIQRRLSFKLKNALGFHNNDISPDPLKIVGPTNSVIADPVPMTYREIKDAVTRLNSKSSPLTTSPETIVSQNVKDNDEQLNLGRPQLHHSSSIISSQSYLDYYVQHHGIYTRPLPEIQLPEVESNKLVGSVADMSIEDRNEMHLPINTKLEGTILVDDDEHDSVFSGDSHNKTSESSIGAPQSDGTHWGRADIPILREQLNESFSTNSNSLHSLESYEEVRLENAVNVPMKTILKSRNESISSASIKMEKVRQKSQVSVNTIPSSNDSFKSCESRLTSAKSIKESKKELKEFVKQRPYSYCLGDSSVYDNDRYVPFKSIKESKIASYNRDPNYSAYSFANSSLNEDIMSSNEDVIKSEEKVDDFLTNRNLYNLESILDNTMNSKSEKNDKTEQVEPFSELESKDEELEHFLSGDFPVTKNGFLQENQNNDYKSDDELVEEAEATNVAEDIVEQVQEVEGHQLNAPEVYENTNSDDRESNFYNYDTESNELPLMNTILKNDQLENEEQDKSGVEPNLHNNQAQHPQPKRPQAINQQAMNVTVESPELQYNTNISADYQQQYWQQMQAYQNLNIQDDMQGAYQQAIQYHQYQQYQKYQQEYMAALQAYYRSQFPAMFTNLAPQDAKNEEINTKLEEPYKMQPESRYIQPNEMMSQQQNQQHPNQYRPESVHVRFEEQPRNKALPMDPMHNFTLNSHRRSYSETRKEQHVPIPMDSYFKSEEIFKSRHSADDSAGRAKVPPIPMKSYFKPEEVVKQRVKNYGLHHDPPSRMVSKRSVSGGYTSYFNDSKVDRNRRSISASGYYNKQLPMQVNKPLPYPQHQHQQHQQYQYQAPIQSKPKPLPPKPIEKPNDFEIEDGFEPFPSTEPNYHQGKIRNVYSDNLPILRLNYH